MAKNVDLNLRLRAADRISRTLKRIQKRFSFLGKGINRASAIFTAFQLKTEKLRKSLAKTGRSMRNIGRNMSVGITAPLGLAGGAIIKTAVDFQKSINRVGALTRTIVGGQVTPQFKALEEQALMLGKTTEFSSTQAAEAMGLLGRAGFQVNEILSSTDDVLALASATGFDLAFSADVMAKTMRQFGVDAENATRVTDVLADISRRSNVDLESLSETFKVAAPIAKTYGATLEQTAAITGLLGDVGLQGSVAGTALKNIFLKIATPSKRATKLLAGMGVAVSQADGSMRSAGQILTDLAPRLAKLPKAGQLDVINELFGLRGIAGASALMSKALDEGRNPIAEMTKVLEGSAGAAKDMQQIMLRGAPGALARMQSAFEGLMLSIANSGLLDAFTDILEFLSKMFSKMSNLNPMILKIGTAFAVVAAVAGPVLIFFGAVASAISTLMPVLGVLKVAVVGIGAVFGLLSTPVLIAIGVVAALGVAAVTLMDAWGDVGDFFSNLWQGALDGFVSFLKTVTGSIPGISKLFNFESTPQINGQVSGEPVGAQQTLNQSAQMSRIERTNNARVGIDFTNMPRGTQVSTESTGLQPDLGFSFAGSR